jgi:carboxymethylenebutenolidase
MKSPLIVLPWLLVVSLVACTPNGNASATNENAVPSQVQTVAFSNGDRELHGLLYKPDGPGPFPAVLYNHGSAPGLANNQAFDAIAPIFLERGWAFFAPYRRGQGLSVDAGPYIMDEINAARRRGGMSDAAETMTRLLSTDHLDDQLAALVWLKAQPFVRGDAIAVMGNSFGGIQAVLGAAQGSYCAAVDAAGGAESWDEAPELQDLLTRTVERAKPPVFFFQAENDFNLEPSRTLFAARHRAGLPAVLKIYPAYGWSRRDGHSFPYRGVSVWRDDVMQFLERHCLS